MSDLFAGLSEEERKRLKRSAPPRRVEPMLATLTDDHFSDPDWIYERKFDGYRCLAYVRGKHVALRSRSDKPFNDAFPEVAEALEGAGDLVLDGEVVAFAGPVTSFQRLQERLSRYGHVYEGRRASIPVIYYVFDLLYAEGHDTRRLPLRARKMLLKKAVVFKDPLRFAAHRNEDGTAYLKDACRRGWEGLIAKDARRPYTSGRSRDWLKFKCAKGQEFAILGFTEPRGSREGFGALVVGYRKGKTYCSAGKVGTGFDHAQLIDLHKRLKAHEIRKPPVSNAASEGKGVHWVEPRLVCEVGFTEWTSAGKLRHPRFIALRVDKRPEEVVRERPG